MHIKSKPNHSNFMSLDSQNAEVVFLSFKLHRTLGFQIWQILFIKIFYKIYQCAFIKFKSLTLSRSKKTMKSLDSKLTRFEAVFVKILLSKMVKLNRAVLQVYYNFIVVSVIAKSCFLVFLINTKHIWPFIFTQVLNVQNVTAKPIKTQLLKSISFNFDLRKPFLQKFAAHFPISNVNKTKHKAFQSHSCHMIKYKFNKINVQMRHL